MYGFDHRKSRAYTAKLLDMAEEGLIDWETLARDALGWMSEAEVQEFAARNDYICPDEDGDEDEYDGQPDEAQEWHDFDPDC